MNTEDWARLGKVILALVVFVGYTFFISIMSYNKGLKNIQIKPPVEDIVKTNDSTKIVIKQLDKDKNEKVIEVKNLNNDSTLKLFRELTRE